MSNQVAPHSLEAEEAVIGSILINAAVFDDVARFLSSADFFSLRHAWIWSAIERLHKRQELIEYITVVEELRTMERLTEVGGAAYVGTLLAQAGTSMHAEAYGQIVRRTAIRRRLMEAAAKISAIAQDEEIGVSQILDKAEAELTRITEGFNLSETAMAANPYMELREKISGLQQGTLVLKYPKTGFPSLDGLLSGGGLYPGLHVWSADTSGGKTLMGLNVMVNMLNQGYRVYWHSLEMDKEAVLRRILSRLSGIPSELLKLGQIPAKQQADYDEADKLMLKLTQRLFLDDAKSVTVGYSLREIKRQLRENRIQAAFVDYPGLFDDSDLKDEGERYKRLGKIARLYQSFALQHQIPVSVMAQQNRDERKGVKGVAESYEMAQHCDSFIFVENEDANEEQSATKTKKISVVKQRDGRRGSFLCEFNEIIQRAEEQSFNF